MRRRCISCKQFAAFVTIASFTSIAINVWTYPKCVWEDEWQMCVRNLLFPFNSSSREDALDPIAAYLRKMKMSENRQGQKGPWAFKKLNAQGDHSEGQSAAIMKYLKSKKNGTYFEAGAHDGEFLSNTLALEYHHGWSGILVEPQPDLYQQLVTKNRRAVTLNGCISPSKEPMNLKMRVSQDGEDWKKGSSSIDGYHVVVGNVAFISVECFPLISILDAAGTRKLDVLCLDVQGAEMQILESLPWELVDITLLVIENDVGDAAQHEQLFKNMTSFVATKGYTYVEHVGLDYLFFKNGSVIS